MSRAGIYSTKQGEAVLSYFRTLGDTHTTVEQISAHFADNGIPIGITTIYRHLDKLEQNGSVRKLIVDGISGACYQYVSKNESDSFHLKCERCGKLYRLDCHSVGEFENHILQSHEFHIDLAKTVLYGMCKDCVSG
ncbi:transcriptional repressor [Clostridia bacterium]|nr:transcriptional repressor [Clostridia bacterium]